MEEKRLIKRDGGKEVEGKKWRDRDGWKEEKVDGKR
jgi:hypothetical protein